MCTQKNKGHESFYYWLNLWLQTPKYNPGELGRAFYLILVVVKSIETKQAPCMWSTRVGLHLHWEPPAMKKGQNRAFGENSYFPHTWAESWHRLIDLEFDYFSSAFFLYVDQEGCWKVLRRMGDRDSQVTIEASCRHCTGFQPLLQDSQSMSTPSNIHSSW